MKDQILKIAGVKTEKEFYKKFPTEESFMAKHGKKIEKLAMGKSMVNKQLKQLTDFGNPPIAKTGLDLSPIKSYSSPGAPTMAALDAKLSNPAFQQQAIAKAEASAPAAPAADAGGMGSTAGAVGMGLAQNLGKIVGGISAIGQQKKKIKQAQSAQTISDLGLQAVSGAKNNQPARQYVRPEDTVAQPDELGSGQGVGTTYFKDGGEIQNTYAPGTLYDNLEEIPTAEFGEYFQDSGQAQLGEVAGETLGNAFFGPVGGAVGKVAGKVLGNALGGAKQARQLKAAQDATLLNQQQTAFQGVMENQFGASMKQGGWVSNDWQPQVITKFGEYNTKDLLKPDPTMDTLRSGGHLAQVGYTAPSEEGLQTYAMGGNLQTHWGGGAELMSYNPYIPGGGETVMFRGQSHDDTNSKGQSGIGITYGDNPVEVERGEPMTEMNGGGVVFGNMMMPGGKQKFKNYVADLSKVEAKQNKVMDKATKLALDADENDPFGRLTLNSSEASLIGANMKLKNIAKKKQDAADLQNAILDTADEMGLVADDLAKGKIKKAKFGARMTAQDGETIYQYNGRILNPKNAKDAEIIKKQEAESAEDMKKIAANYGKPSSEPVLEKIVIPDAPIVPYEGPSFAGLPGYTQDTKSPSVMESINSIFPNRQRANMPAYNADLSPVTLPRTEVNKVGMANLPAGFAERAMANAEGLTPAGVEKPGFLSRALGTLGKGAKATGNILEKGYDKYGETALSALSPFLRPTDQEGLDPNQLMGEQYALAMNQLEPVQAQKFQPTLQGAPSDISYQDQLNEITAQSRAAERMSQYNPEAAASIFGQVSQAKNKVLAEQFRANQARKEEVYNANRQRLDDAQKLNLQLLDQQYVRQSQAKSATKAQAQTALNSIADKIAKNKLENRQLGVMENMYNYRFDPMGRAINMNTPAQFNVPNVGSTAKPKDASGEDLIPIYNDDNTIKGYKVKKDTKSTAKKYNGAIVKALKNI